MVFNVLVRLLAVDGCKSRTYNAKSVQNDDDNSMNFVNLHLGTAKWLGAALLAVVILLVSYYVCRTYRERNRERRRSGLPNRWLPTHISSMRARRGSAPARSHSPHRTRYARDQAHPSPHHAQVAVMEQYRPRKESQ